MAHQTLFKFNSYRIAFCLIIIAVVSLVSIGSGISSAASLALPAASASHSIDLTAAREFSNSVVYQSNGVAGCRNSTNDESLMIARRDQNSELTTISPPRLHSTDGLQLILRATPELDANPAAKAVFLRAADLWASRIQSTTTVFIDVDFGPKWFGNEFPEGAMGITNPQMLIASGHYFSVLNRLVNSASDSKELALYMGLPMFTPIPTDLGDTMSVLAPSAVYRTLNLINPDPTFDPPFYGPAPAIGFNSAMDFDFDASNGIDAGKYDFEAVVAHEMGHILGFVSAVGQRELNPNCELAVTVWDLFRLRPGASMGGLATSDRILSSGGAQVFFEGDTELQLSTGRPDSEDGLQPSHWRDDSIVGQQIGLMDPTIPAGARQSITFNDLIALDLFGYTLKPFGNNRPTISSLAADLNGDKLTVTGSGTDPDGDVVQVEAQFLDQRGRFVAQTAPFDAGIGISPTLAVRVNFTGMGSLADATQVSLVLIDSRGNRSPSATADFSGGDPGAVKLSAASYEKNRLLIKGKRLTADTQVEINGVIVAPPEAVTISPNGKKLTIAAPIFALGLRDGSNRIRVINGGLRSNLLVTSF